MVGRGYGPPGPPGAVRPGAGSGLDPRRLGRLVARLERGQYRQIQALLVISGILSGTILLAARVPPAPWGISALGVLVLLGAGVWSTWLLWVSRRHLREWE